MEIKSTREKLLKAMYDLLAEQGYDKTSIGQLADTIGIKKASVYYYFRFKEQILLELVKNLYEWDEDDKCLQKIKTKGDFRKFLLQEGYSFVDTFESNSKARRVFAEIDIQISRIPSLKEYVDSYIEKEKERWKSILSYGQKIGAVSQKVNTLNYANYLFTMQTGIDDALLYHYSIDCKEVWAMAVATVLGGDDHSV